METFLKVGRPWLVILRLDFIISFSCISYLSGSFFVSSECKTVRMVEISVLILMVSMLFEL